MNANPAYCDCERCEIDRERSLTDGRGARLSAKRPRSRSALGWIPWKAADITTRRKPMGLCWR